MLAHSSSQPIVPPMPGLAGTSIGGPRNPQVQIRAAMSVCPPVKESVPKIASPRVLTGDDGRSHPWSARDSTLLCGEADAAKFIGRVRFLDRNLASSVQQAVDGLNKGTIICQEDACVVLAATERSHYLVYRSGRRESVFSQLGLVSDGNKCVSPYLRPQDRVPSRGPAIMAAAVKSQQDGSNNFALNSPPMPPTIPQAAHMDQPIQAMPVGTGVSGCFSCVSGSPGPSGARKGRPPLGGAATRTQSARGVAPSGQWVHADETGSATSHQRHASPVAKVASYQPGYAVVRSPVPRSGHVTPTPPIKPMIVIGSPNTSTPGVPLPPPQLVAAGPAQQQSPSAVQNPQQNPPREPATPQKQLQHLVTTPRQGLEYDLTDPEKIKYEDLEFVESLGSGEFGQVFRGKFWGTEVAIKQLYWDDSMTELVMQDLSKEIESFRHLRHKRLVRFIGACLDLPNPCLVTEYCPGGSLHHLLHVRKLQLPLLHSLNMCLQIADGVMYLHNQNPIIVHRDLKSLNVVLDLSLNVKICDFGLTEPMERTHITKKNNGGSPRYMAPELFDSKTKITEKIDVWAMGCIFVEICGGPLPYEDIQTLADLTREMLVNGRPPDVPAYIPEEARIIVRSCLIFDYRLRPTSRGAFEHLRAAKRRLREAGKL